MCMAYDAKSVALRTGTSTYSIPSCQGVDESCTGNGNCTAGSFDAGVKDARHDSRVRLARRGDLHGWLGAVICIGVDGAMS